MKLWSQPSLLPGSNLRSSTCIIIYHDNTGPDIDRSIMLPLSYKHVELQLLQLCVRVHQCSAQPQRCPGY